MDPVMPFTWRGALDHQSQSQPIDASESAVVRVAHDDALRCGYSSKKCFNARTTKKGGGLHRFCEFHRRRANTNQWRVDDKRRGVRAERRQQLKRLRAASGTRPPRRGASATTMSMHDPLRRDPQELLRDELALTMEEIQLLQAILFDDDHADELKAHSVVPLAPPSPSCVGAFVV